MEKAIFLNDRLNNEALRSADDRRPLRMTYAQLYKCVKTLAQELSLQPGTVWAIMLPNGVEFACAFLALVMASCAGKLYRCPKVYY
jgi:acyl-CoA synthetase (AMP-forming)/AMP-acid ligase II